MLNANMKKLALFAICATAVPTHSADRGLLEAVSPMAGMCAKISAFVVPTFVLANFAAGAKDLKERGEAYKAVQVAQILSGVMVTASGAMSLWSGMSGINMGLVGAACIGGVCLGGFTIYNWYSCDEAKHWNPNLKLFFATMMFLPYMGSANLAALYATAVIAYSAALQLPPTEFRKLLEAEKATA